MTNNGNKLYQKNGIMIDPAMPHPNHKAKISYNGLLNKCGATHVYAHVGFNKEWNHQHDYEMTKKSNGFEVEIPIEYANTLNVAFKDCANNWDNNSGNNYTFDVAHKSLFR